MLHNKLEANCKHIDAYDDVVSLLYSFITSSNTVLANSHTELLDPALEHAWSHGGDIILAVVPNNTK